MVSMQFHHKMHSHKMEFRDYILALEEEKKKIQVFPRDLPLSLELVTQGKQNKPEEEKKNIPFFYTMLKFLSFVFWFVFFYFFFICYVL